jgi:hypothetical protein
LIGSHSPPIWSSSPVLQLISEPVWSLVGFNRLCDPEGNIEKGDVKLVVFNSENFDYWKNRTRNYLLSQGPTIREIIQQVYMIPVTLDNVTQGVIQRYENNYKALNLITTAVGRNVYDRVAHLEIAHYVWLKLCNTYEGSSEIKSSRKDTYNRQYQTFSQNPRESLDDCFARFESIVSNLCSCGPLA